VFEEQDTDFAHDCIFVPAYISNHYTNAIDVNDLTDFPGQCTTQVNARRFTPKSQFFKKHNFTKSGLIKLKFKI